MDSPEKDSYIQQYGKLLLNKTNIKNSRLIFNINDVNKKCDLNFSMKLFEKLTDYINSNLKIKLDEMHFKNSTRVNRKGFDMEWHIDDAQIIKNNKEKLIELEDNPDLINISENTLLYTNSAPKYSLIYYESDHEIDFIGGELEFVDGLKILPKKGMAIFFDSKEVHKVNQIKSGERKNTLIKFY